MPIEFRALTRQAVLGALCWGLAMTASLWVGLQMQVGGFTAHRAALAGLYFGGGVLSFPIALIAVRQMFSKRPPETRFAASFVLLTSTTLALTAVLSALIYLNLYADWRGDRLSYGWLVHLAYSGASSLYQFAVVGTRLYLPLGIVALLVASVWMARHSR